MYPRGTGALGVPVRHRGAGFRASCHFVLIPTPFIHQILQSIEIGTKQRLFYLYRPSTGGAEFRLASGAASYNRSIIYVSCQVR